MAEHLKNCDRERRSELQAFAWDSIRYLAALTCATRGRLAFFQPRHNLAGGHRVGFGIVHLALRSNHAYPAL